MSEIQTVPVNVKEVKGVLKKSLDFLAGMVAPEVYKFPYPPILLAVWASLMQVLSAERSFEKLMLCLPRGIAKSFLVKLACVWAILFTTKRFILVVGATQDLAENIIDDVADMLRSPNIVDIFGDFKTEMSTDTKNKKIFSFQGRTIILAAMGAGGTMRGLNVKNARPDIVICDDAQTKENAMSPTQSAQFKEWFYSTLKFVRDPMQCSYIYIGNMYKAPKDVRGKWGCLLRELKDSPDWTSFISGAILEDGKSIWEDLFPIKNLLADLREAVRAGLSATFFAEIQNDPDCEALSGFDFNSIKIFDPEIPRTLIGRFWMIDPSTGGPDSDDNVMQRVSTYQDSTVVLDKNYCDKYSPSQCVEMVLSDCIEEGTRLVTAESVAYQSTLLHWFEVKSLEKNIPPGTIYFEKVSTGGLNKNLRITNFLRDLAAGTYEVHPDLYEILILKISQFDPLKNNKLDDFLDCCAQTPRIIQQYPDKMLHSYITTLREDEEDGEDYDSEEYQVF